MMEEHPQNSKLSVRHILWAGANLYAIVIAIYVILYTVSGTRIWPVYMLANFIHWLLPLAIIILPVALVNRRWIATVGSAVGVIALIILFSGYFLPKSVNAAENTLPIRAMTFNVLADFADADSLVAMLQETRPDIVGITELGYRQAEALEEAALYPYQELYPAGIPGIALLSRYPILEHEQLWMTGSGMPHLRATLDVEGHIVTVIVAHPPPPTITDSGYRQAATTVTAIETLAQLAAEGAPTILLGDFNATDQSDEYNILIDAGLTDAFRASGWGFGLTWPNLPVKGKLPLPAMIRIDYIFTTAQITPLDAWVGDSIGSDHAPVIADLALAVE